MVCFPSIQRDYAHHDHEATALFQYGERGKAKAPCQVPDRGLATQAVRLRDAKAAVSEAG
ncbi:hypothetical protein DWU98_15210 [Dyella monticola]|uniref:Uncharacterized protein n=1 Tax=Dyella monticola TaxID=1927958 RepID=A0A370WW24_9GAMM|nr:hypothetical protein DWU98_15210 [Dyella monticola]